MITNNGILGSQRVVLIAGKAVIYESKAKRKRELKKGNSLRNQAAADSIMALHINIYTYVIIIMIYFQSILMKKGGHESHKNTAERNKLEEG